ncbi:MAG: hypothetical protein WA140_13290 [Geobacteraceae bacterium]
MSRYKLLAMALLCALFVLSACNALLPSAKESIRTPWASFDDARGAYDRVIPNVTTANQLKAIGFDLYSTPNVRRLNYVDISIATQSIKREELNNGFQVCIAAKDRCKGYEIEPRRVQNERYGNFWLDVLNFRRKTRETGWRFKALFVIVDDIVVDKLWSGAPYIVQERDARNPLGPFQDVGGLIMRVIP